MKIFWFIAAFAVLTSCKNDDNGNVINEPTTFGLAYSISDSNFTTTYNTLRNSLQSNPNITIIAEVNHSANAQAAGLNLRNTRLIIFGNPTLGTPVMQANQLAGIDLPQKMLIYQDAGGNVFVAYNGTSYLAARHAGAGGASTLSQISMALSSFAQGATNMMVSENTSAGVTNRQGIRTIPSANDFTTTYNDLRNAISDNPNLTIIREVDHQDNANSVGLDLNPTRLIIFGNPTLGTPLMQSAQTAGIDLPQKMLVWEDDNGDVNVSFNNPEYLQERHNILNNTENIETIKSVLTNLALDATD